MSRNQVVWDIISWIFGILVLAIGLINLFYGNDPGFGAFVMLLSLVYFPPVNRLIRRRFDIGLHYVVKILLGIFILWAALGVGELFDKTGMMLRSFGV
jgi:hypothetical protein